MKITTQKELDDLIATADKSNKIARISLVYALTLFCVGLFFGMWFVDDAKEYYKHKLCKYEIEYCSKEQITNN